MLFNPCLLLGEAAYEGLIAALYVHMYRLKLYTRFSGVSLC